MKFNIYESSLYNEETHSFDMTDVYYAVPDTNRYTDIEPSGPLDPVHDQYVGNVECEMKYLGKNLNYISNMARDKSEE